MATTLSEFMESSMPKKEVVEAIEDFFKTEISNKFIHFELLRLWRVLAVIFPAHP